MLSTRPDNPVDQHTVAVLEQLDRVVRKLGRPYVVLGATARDVWLTHVYGLAIERATNDVDLAVACESWAAFNEIKQSLINTGNFQQDPAQVQRLRQEPTDRSTGYPVDILPFGGVEANVGEIAWPPDSAVRMNVLGYEEALRNATPVQIGQGVTIPFCTLPNLAAVKLLAWLDRRHRTTKDALDFAQMISVYGQAGTQDRLYGEAQQLLEAAGYDVQIAAARLLGGDVSAAVSNVTAEALIGVLSNGGFRDELLCHMAPAFRAADDKYRAAELLLDEFMAGLVGSTD